MATDILIKRSTTSGAIPTTGDLSTGELAINTADKRLFTNNSGTIVEIGTAPTSLVVTNNATVGGTLGVTGNTTLTTVSTSGAATLASGSVTGNFSVAGTLSVATPSNSTDAASKGYVDTAVANVIDSAPGALDTLNELAAAINDDANFATTITNALAGKLALAGGTMTGDITLGANKITSTATPATDDTLTRKGYVDTILGSATDAATSAAAAAVSETNAANSASAASTSASNASTSATNAATSETNASTSATNASTSATAAASSATSASNSASAAATSATNAGTSETNASTSETNAATSETNAATSATNASNSATSASTSATNAANSASAASTSETNAATSETNASNSATSASTSATNAASSATSAASAQTAAESARDATLAAYDQFDDRYLGAKASDPSVDNDGNALIAGALYFNTTDESMKLYTGSAWVDAYASGSGFLTDIVGDTTPQLGGNLDLNSNDITGTGNINVTGTVTADGLTLSSASSPNLNITDTTNTVTTQIASTDTQGFIGTITNHPFQIVSNGTKRLRIESNGDINLGYEATGTTPKLFWDASAESLGIGTSSPGQKLEILKSGGGRIRLSETSARYVEIIGYAEGTANGSTMAFNTIESGTSTLTERMRIDSSGNLLVGKTASSLSTAGVQAQADGALFATRTGDSVAWLNKLSADGDIVRFQKDATTVGSIGCASGDLTVTSASDLKFYTSTSNEDMRLETDGDLHVDGDVIAYSTTISDERLKTNIQGIENAVAKVSQLNGYTFEYTADGKISAGVIAQEVEKVLPEAVSEKQLPLKANDDQEYKVVNYDALHGLLIEAIKELTARVEALEAK